jgi:hypothetical protein
MSSKLTALKTVSALLFLLLPVATVPAAIVAEDDFTYPNGPLVGNNGGTGWINAWGDTAMLVISGEAIGADTATDPKFGSRNFSNPGTTPELFVAFDLRAPASFADNDYWVLNLSIGANITHLSVGKIPGSNLFHVGNGGFVPSSITIQPGVTYHVVATVDRDQGRVAMWIDPDASDYYVPTTGQNSAEATMVNSVSFDMARVDFVTNTRLGFAVDNIVLSNTPENAGLLSTAPCLCLGDMNADTVRDGLDTQQFLDCLIAGGLCTCADVDAIPGVTVDDLSVFVDNMLADTPCPP